MSKNTTITQNADATAGAKAGFKPAALRGLVYLAPEGSTVGAWTTKAGAEERYFYATTTKKAGWSGIKNRKQLTEVADYDALIDALGSLTGSHAKVGAALIKHLDEMFEPKVDVPAELLVDTEQEIVVEHETIVEQAEQVIETPVVDAELAMLVEKARGRSIERNTELLAQLEVEVAKLATREDIEPAKREAMTARKVKMHGAITMVLASAQPAFAMASA